MPVLRCLGQHRPLTCASELAALWRAAGLEEVTEESLSVPPHFVRAVRGRVARGRRHGAGLFVV